MNPTKRDVTSCCHNFYWHTRTVDEREPPDYLLLDEEIPLAICIVIHSSRYADSVDVMVISP
jgi:hypothetical protein